MRHNAAEQSESPDQSAEHAEAVARIVAAAVRGDETAWESLVRLYGRRIYALAKSRLRDADSAEEITQSVFATLAEKLRGGGSAQYEEAGKFEPWLFRIAMNRVRDEGRRRQRRGSSTFRLADSDSELAATEGPDKQSGTAEAAGELAAMRSAIQSLEDRDREIIELRHHGSLSFAQIATTLDEPMGTVLARHHRALKKLRQRIESLDINARPEATGRAAGSNGGSHHA